MRTTNRSSNHMARTKKTQKDERSSCNTWPKQENQFQGSPKQVQVKFTRQPFPESSKLFENCFQEHPQIQVQFKLHGQQFQTTTKTKNKLWSSAAGISHLIRDHLNPITATSLDHTSTLVQNDQQQNKEQKQSIMQKSPNESTNVQLVTSDIKTATTSETDDIEMQNSDMNISATAKLTSAKTLFYS